MSTKRVLLFILLRVLIEELGLLVLILLLVSLSGRLHHEAWLGWGLAQLEGHELVLATKLVGWCRHVQRWLVLA